MALESYSHFQCVIFCRLFISVSACNLFYNKQCATNCSVRFPSLNDKDSEGDGDGEGYGDREEDRERGIRK